MIHIKSLSKEVTETIENPLENEIKNYSSIKKFTTFLGIAWCNFFIIRLVTYIVIPIES